jgi:hypothetical protein
MSVGARVQVGFGGGAVGAAQLMVGATNRRSAKKVRSMKADS